MECWRSLSQSYLVEIQNKNSLLKKSAYLTCPFLIREFLLIFLSLKFLSKLYFFCQASCRTASRRKDWKCQIFFTSIILISLMERFSEYWDERALLGGKFYLFNEICNFRREKFQNFYSYGEKMKRGETSRKRRETKFWKDYFEVMQPYFISFSIL